MLFASNILKISALLILSNYVFLSEQYQPCLRIARPRGNGEYSFALAPVEDYHNPLGAQEACYFSCGAEVVTQSSNKGDMNRLTLMDNAAPFLTASGFLKIGESYFLNHLGMEDEEGGNGIGCIEVKPGNIINHYPKTHAVCSMAKTAICGFWGQQSIPPQPKEVKPKPSPTPKKSRKPKPTRRPKPKPKTSPAITVTESKSVNLVYTSYSLSTVQSTTSISEVPSSSRSVATNVMTEIVTVSDIQTGTVQTVTEVVIAIGTQVVNSLPTSTITGVSQVSGGGSSTSTLTPESEVAGSAQFKVDGTAFHVISKLENSLASAGNTCSQNQAEVASVTSQSFTAVSEKLKEMDQGKVIIGTWNGDSYSLTGENCLILQINHGIYPGTCSDATAILCQSST